MKSALLKNLKPITIFTREARGFDWQRLRLSATHAGVESECAFCGQTIMIAASAIAKARSINQNRDHFIARCQLCDAELLIPTRGAALTGAWFPPHC